MDGPGRKRWSRHGSTRYLNEDAAVAAAVDYVLHCQGEPMAVYDAATAQEAESEGLPAR
jgi:hypothetical protein